MNYAYILRSVIKMTNRDKLNKVITNDFDINYNYTSIRKKMEIGNKMNKIFKYSLVPMAIVIAITSVFLLNKKNIYNIYHLIYC